MERNIKMEYTPQISLGSIISAVSMLGAAGAVYAAVISKDIQHDERIARNAEEIVRVEKQSVESVKELRAELQEVNRNLVSIDRNLRYSPPPVERKNFRVEENTNAFSRPNTR